MKVTCFKDDPKNVVFTFQKEHNNEVGTRDDFSYLPVSKTTKDFIMQKLVEGYDCRDIRISIQRELNQHIQEKFNIVVDGNDSINSIIHRDQVIDSNEVYNQYKKKSRKSLQRKMMINKNLSSHG